MSLLIRDPVHGHQVCFPNASPAPPISDVTWGPSSISVPSTSPLNGPADVYLRLPFTPARAARWCVRRNLTYLGPWFSHGALLGFAFSVPGFSRYRYVESDDDDDAPSPPPHATPQPLSPAARRRIRVHAAGRTPIRPTATAQPAAEGAPASAARKRMTPRIALYDSDDASSGDERDGERTTAETDGEGPDSDSREEDIPAADPFQPLRWPAGGDEARRRSFKYALFDQARGEEADEGMGEDDVPMEDVARDEDEPLDVFEEAERRQVALVGEGEVAVRPEAGEFLVEGAESGLRRRPGSVYFPSHSLPYPAARDSVAAGKEGVRVDTGLMLGRSTRVAFGHAGDLMWPCYGVNTADARATPGFVVGVGDVFHPRATVPRESLSKMLRVHCGTWFGSISVQEAEASDQEGGLKMPSLKDGFEFAEVADTTIAQFVEELKFCHDERGDVNALHAHVALSMLLALYKQDNDPVYVGGNTLLRRIAEWADGPAGVAFDEEGNCKAVGLRSAVLNLSLGKIEEAVAAAAEAGHLRLSLLIARALEAPKEGLREDALAQLDAYGLLHEQEESNRSSAEDSTSDAGIDWDAILKDCPYDAEVTVDERMILLMLTGQVGCVASFLGLSWYRLFIMEFFHGAGSSDLTQAERVSAAVNAIDEERISTLAPHGYGQAIDVVYHLLRLYADPTASYPLTAGVYENESVGAIYSPLDARFSWLIYQVLTAVIPQASTPNAPQMLADEFSSQLRAAGLHLWSFYVLCSGGAPAHVMRSVLMRNWPNMLNDVVEWTPAGEADSAGGMRDDEHGERGMDSNLEELAGKLDAETFLEDVLGVPKPWIAEAKAIAAHVEEDLFTECKHWTACGTENGATRAHELLSKHVFPEMIACKDGSQLEEVASVLRQLEGFKHVANWSISGGLILNYLEDTLEKRGKKRQPLSVYRAMVDRVCAYAARASTPEQVYAGSVMADEIATAERAVLFDAKGEEREEMVEFLVEDLERLPCSKSVKVRITGEYKTEMKRGQAVARRFSTAHVPYSRFVQ